MKTTQEIVLFSPVFCPTIGGRFKELKEHGQLEESQFRDIEKTLDTIFESIEILLR
jgi:hypothetical protein